jgi:hypothetical protein
VPKHIRQALRLLKKGLVRKAMRILLRSTGIADASLPEVQQELQRLLPDVLDPLPSLAANAPYVIVSEEEYHKRLLAMQCSSAHQVRRLSSCWPCGQMRRVASSLHAV